MKRNTILVGNAFETLENLPDGSLSGCGTSPPYWSVRNYGTDPIVIGGDPACVHAFDQVVAPARKWTPGDVPSPGSILGKQRKNLGMNHGNGFFHGKYAGEGKARGPDELRPGVESRYCSKCGAWKGSLGLEPDPDQFVSDLADLFEIVVRKLADWGCFHVNLGDTYSGSGGAGGDWTTGKRAEEPKWKQAKTGLPQKSLVGIPARFEVEMLRRGYSLRNVPIWWKRSCMPSSTRDRFTIDYEYLFFFVKNSGESIFWINHKDLRAMKVAPPDVEHGVEGKDWDWQMCRDCEGTGKTHRCDDKECDSILLRTQQTRLTSKKPRPIFWCEECGIEIENPIVKPCDTCETTGRVKTSYWEGRDYYFNQLFEPTTEATRRRVGKPITYGGTSKTDDTAAEYCNPTYRGATIYNPAHKNERNMRCVWDIPVKGFKGRHFAVFPPDLVKRWIEATCPRYVCSKCGLPRVPLDAGLTDCGCGAPFERGLWLDPFMGSGTSGMVAQQLGRDWIGCELNSTYAKNAIARINSNGRKKEAKGVEKSPSRLDAYLPRFNPVKPQP